MATTPYRVPGETPRDRPPPLALSFEVPSVETDELAPLIAENDDAASPQTLPSPYLVAMPFLGGAITAAFAYSAAVPFLVLFVIVAIAAALEHRRRR